jgi:transposase
MNHLNCRAKITYDHQRRKKRVIDLYYNQGKATREIAKIERMSIRDISTILKEEEARRQKYKQEELTSKAYKLFSEGKRRVEVAIALNLRESEATKFYKEYWKLKQLHNLNALYEEIKDDIAPFLKLYRLSKAAGMSARHVITLLEIANTNLPDIQCR